MEKKSKREEKIEEIKEYFRSDADLFTEAIEELDYITDIISPDDRFYDMGQLDEDLESMSPTDIINRAYYGYDADRYDTDSRGDKTYGPFNPSRNYYYWNGYGNLVSCDDKDYTDSYLYDEYIDMMQEHRNQIPSIRDDYDLSELFDELDEIDMEEEENEE